jgi:hypothetical protein
VLRIDNLKSWGDVLEFEEGKLPISGILLDVDNLFKLHDFEVLFGKYEFLSQ